MSDDDYEQWRAVRLAVLPYERCSTVAQLRAADSPDRMMVLARIDGVVVGHGLAARSESTDSGFVAPRVLDGHRRRGAGTALLHALTDHLATLGLPTVRTKVDDEGSGIFAQHFDFTEVDREVEQTYVVEGAPVGSPIPEGIEVVTAQEQPGLWEESYERFGRESLADFAVTTPLEVSSEQWSRVWLADPMFLAVHDGEVVGCAGLELDSDLPGRAENALTAVRRDWRGRGVAVHLKLRALAWAAAHDVGQVYTWTQDGNAAMRALNARLGYATTRTSISLSRPLPL